MTSLKVSMRNCLDFHGSGVAFRVLAGLVLLQWLSLAMPVQAADIPLPDVSMIVTGALSASSDGKLVPADGDAVLVVNVGTGKTEATANFNGGGYTASLSKPAAFNGTQLVLRLVHLNTTYRLTKGDGSDAILIFNGSLLPVQTILNLFATATVVGTSGGGTTGGGTTGGDTTGGGTTGGGPSIPLIYDINSDKKVDEVDIQLLKDAIAGRRALDKTKMDVNTDGVVNTRDLIEVIRSVRDAAREARKPASIIPARN